MHDSTQTSLFYASRAIVNYVLIKCDKWRVADEPKFIKLLEKVLNWKEISEEMPDRSEDTCYSYYNIMMKINKSDR